MRPSDQRLMNLQESSSFQEWRYVAPATRRPVAITMWKDETLPAATTALRKWAHAFLMVLAVAVVTGLSGIGFSMLCQRDLAPSSDESGATSRRSDAHSQQLLQAHRNVVLGVWSPAPRGHNRSNLNDAELMTTARSSQ